MTKTTMHAPERVAPLAYLPPSPEGGLTVTLVRWPRDEDHRRRLAVAGVPRLLFVDADAAPPGDWGIDEDWVRLPADSDEVRLRVQTLCRRTGARAPDLDTTPWIGWVRPNR